MRKKIRDSLPFRALGLVGEENLLPTWSRLDGGLDGIESGATRLGRILCCVWKNRVNPCEMN
jgi:hypothetical protein